MPAQHGLAGRHFPEMTTGAVVFGAPDVAKAEPIVNGEVSRRGLQADSNERFSLSI